MKEIEISSLSAIEHLLAHRPDRVKRLRLNVAKATPRVEALKKTAKQWNIPMEVVKEISRDREASEPVRAWLPPFDYTELKPFLETASAIPKGLVLALDHLQDPQNFGALCRSAEGLGVSGILIPKDRGVSVSPGVYHASVGAVETIPVIMVTNLSEALRKLKDIGFWILGTTLEGENATHLGEVPDFEKIVLVLGAELEGLSHGIDKECDWRVQIPLSGRVQSLNVSVAGGILMHHFLSRQKKNDSKHRD